MAKLDLSGYLSLPTVTLLPPGEHPEEGSNQGKRMMGECSCHFLSVYKKQITVGEAHEVNFGHPVVLFPVLFLLKPSLLPVSDLKSV